FGSVRDRSRLLAWCGALFHLSELPVRMPETLRNSAVFDHDIEDFLPVMAMRITCRSKSVPGNSSSHSTHALLSRSPPLLDPLEYFGFKRNEVIVQPCDLGLDLFDFVTIDPADR